MRHRNHKNKLGRTSAHRIALLRNLAKSFIVNGRIVTTLQKAKELKKVIEPLITVAKNDNLVNRRKVIDELGLHQNKLTSKESRKAKGGDCFCYNSDRVVVEKIFKEIAPKFIERPGGYLRIVKQGLRVGDSAFMCVVECVS